MSQTGGTPSGDKPIAPPGGTSATPTSATPTSATPTSATPTSTATTSSSSGDSAWRTWLPALAFVLGAALTAAVFLIGGSDDPELAASPDGEVAATAEPSPAPLSSDPALLVRVPAACLEAAEFTDTVTSSLGDLAGAARDLDARRLQETLDALQQLRPGIEAASSECRDLAAGGEVVTASPIPTTAPDAAEPTQPSASEPTDAPAVSGAPTPAT